MSNRQGSSRLSQFNGLLKDWGGRFIARWNQRATKYEKSTLIALNLILMLIVFRDYIQQKISADRVWIAQQLPIIYDMEWATDSAGNKVYQPKAHVRSREDAVKAYVAMAGHKGEARLPKAILNEMALSRVDFSSVDFSRATFQGANMKKSDLEESILVGADFRGTILLRADLSDADMTAANLQGAILSDADLEDAILERATLGVCAKPEVDLGTGEQYSGSLWRAVECRGADFDGAVLRGTFVCGVDLTDVRGLTQEQINRAIGDESTKLPAHLKMPEYWHRKHELVGPPYKKENRMVTPPVREENQRSL
jgi:hypothetical protein